MEKYEAPLFRGEGLLGLPERWLPSGFRKVLLVHSPSISEEHIKSAVNYLQKEAEDFLLLPFSTPILEWDNVLREVRHISHFAFDTIIALGGGTVIDLAKCIKYHLQPHARLIAIPSTVGTGSEATCFATYYEAGRKRSLQGDQLLPDRVVLDPDLCLTLSDRVLQSTCLDAFCQAIESYWSVHSTPESRKLSLTALSLILPAAEKGITRHRKGVLADLQLAAFLSGKAINIAKTTLSHALSYRLTSHHGIPHGYAVAATPPAVAQYNAVVTREDCQDVRGVVFVQRRLYALTRAVGKVPSLSKALEGWIEKIGGKFQLQHLAPGIMADLESIVDEAMESGRAGNNPRMLHRGELIRLLREI